MDLKKEIQENINNISSLIFLSRQLKKFVRKNNNKLTIKKTAFLSNFNLKGLSECLVCRSFLQNVFIDTYNGQYNQWKQEIINDKLYNFQPDMIFIILDFFDNDQDLTWSYHYLKKNKIKKIVDDKLNEASQFIKNIKNRTKAKIVVSNFPIPWPKFLGIIDNKIESSLSKTISLVNLRLQENYQNDTQVFVFDLDGWLGNIGKEKNWGDKYYFLADMRLSPKAIPILANELISFIIPLASATKKCLVLDLDNTLWGGIIGEDGLEGIKLGPTGQGRFFYLLQKMILGLSHRGIILAINSKNNLADVKKVFLSHPYMVLKEKHFAALRINWQDKAANFKELAQELNIGLDSMVFVDDDPANRALIKEMIPEVEVIDLPPDPAEYIKILMSYQGFSSFKFTKEDKGRGEMYFKEKKRREFQAKIIDKSIFLKKLKLRIIVKPISKFSLPRAAQLTQKTNQFNLSTIRYQEEDIKKMIKEKAKIWTLEVYDKFGDYGLTGLAIIKNFSDSWHIDTFLLSCRILGKEIEEQFLGFILNELKKIKDKKVIGRYVPSPKNYQVEYFYKKVGFKKSDKFDKINQTWEVYLRNYKFVKKPFIKIN